MVAPALTFFSSSCFIFLSAANDVRRLFLLRRRSQFTRERTRISSTGRSIRTQRPPRFLED